MTTLKEIYSKVCDMVTKDEFNTMIQEKIKEYNGLCDEYMAAMLVANELSASNTRTQKICPFRSDYRDENTVCVREGCQLWNRDSDECAFQGISSGLWAMVDIMRKLSTTPR